MLLKKLTKSVLFLSSLMFSLCLIFSDCAFAETKSGTLGDNNGVNWSFDSGTGILTISGSDSGVEASESLGWNDYLQMELFTYDSPFKDMAVKKVKFSDCAITGGMYRFFNGLKELKEVDFTGLDSSNVDSMGALFEGCEALTTVNLEKLDTSNVTNMSSMFKGCKSLATFNFSNFDTYNVTKMDNMFEFCTSVKQLDLGSFDTRNLTSMFFMFNHCESLTYVNLTSFDTSKVDDMSALFQCCENLDNPDLINFNTSIVKNTSYMFFGCTSLSRLNLSKFDLSKVTDTDEMFGECNNLTYLKTPNKLAQGQSIKLAMPLYTDSNTLVSSITPAYTETILQEKSKDLTTTGLKAKDRISNAITLTWDRNTDADGYEVWMYKKSGWTKLTTITSNATTIYKATKLGASINYKFKVRSYANDGSVKNYGAYITKTIKTRPTYVKGLNFSTRTTNSVSLNWNKNTSADGYEIWMYKKTGWTKLITIIDEGVTNYRVKGLGSSTNYKFKIRSYKWDNGVRLYSAGYTEKIVKTLPSYIKGFSCNKKTTYSIELKWTKNTSTDGYVVEQLKNGKWTTIKIIPNEATTKFRVSGLKRATSYKFRIKGYAYEAKTKLYGAYASTTIKTN